MNEIEKDILDEIFVKKHPKIVYLKKGCKLITNKGECGKDNYLCGECRSLIRNIENYNRKGTRFEQGFNQGSLSKEKEVLKIIDEELKYNLPYPMKCVLLELKSKIKNDI